MKFDDIHCKYFGAKRGGYKRVTYTEDDDSQVTVTDYSREIVREFFGEQNILKGPKKLDPLRAAKKFFLYPNKEEIVLNLVYPKPKKRGEMRLYLSHGQRFHPREGDVWFVFIDHSHRLFIGFYTSAKWNIIEENSVLSSEKNESEKEETYSEIDLTKVEAAEVRKYRFQHGARSIVQMGEELIGHPTSAINELVKNGYDADATEVKVSVILGKNKEESYLVVQDNGTGMDQSVLFGSWLQPSVSSKREITHSPIFERAVLGSKGIGRLAAMALGENLTVISKTTKSEKYNWISLSSRQFRNDELLSNVEFPGDTLDNFYEVFENPSFLKTRDVNINRALIEHLKATSFSDSREGTLVIIEGLDEGLMNLMFNDFSQSENNIKIQDTKLLKSLAILVTPLELNGTIQQELEKKGLATSSRSVANESSTFNLQYTTNLAPQYNTTERYLNVKPIRILEGFDYRVIGRVNVDGSVNGEFEYKRLSSQNLSTPFEIPKEELQPKQTNLFDHKESLKGESAGAFVFDIRVYDREKDSIEKLADILNEKKSDVRKTITNLAGIRVSKNGFGVKPYGEEFLDWLGLAQKRVQDPGKNITPNQALGYVYLSSPENDELKEKTNREGFYENSSFISLKNTLLRVMADIGQRRYNYRFKNNLGRPVGKQFMRPDSSAYLNFITTKITDKEIVNKTRSYIDNIDTALDHAEKNLSLAERLASLGNSLELMYHELAQPISILGTSEHLLEIESNNIEPKVVRSKIKNEILEIGEAIETLDELKESLEPAVGKSILRNFKPIDTFDKVCRLYKRDIAEYSIQIKIDSQLNAFTFMANEHAFWVAFLNIINNAVFWLKSTEKGDKSLIFTLEDESLIISNTGPFIDSNVLEDIFEYGVSTKPGTNKSGLGLTFTKNILERNNFSIKAENRDYGPAFIISTRTQEDD